MEVQSQEVSLDGAAGRPAGSAQAQDSFPCSLLSPRNSAGKASAFGLEAQGKAAFPAVASEGGLILKGGKAQKAPVLLLEGSFQAKHREGKSVCSGPPWAEKG